MGAGVQHIIGDKGESEERVKGNPNMNSYLYYHTTRNPVYLLLP